MRSSSAWRDDGHWRLEDAVDDDPTLARCCSAIETDAVGNFPHHLNLYLPCSSTDIFSITVSVRKLVSNLIDLGAVATCINNMLSTYDVLHSVDQPAHRSKLDGVLPTTFAQPLPTVNCQTV
jgi:hypothetical protein